MREGQALERVNRVLEASWDRRKGFWSRLEANLKRLGGFREAFGGCHRRPRPRFQRLHEWFSWFFSCFVAVTGQK